MRKVDFRVVWRLCEAFGRDASFIQGVFFTVYICVCGLAKGEVGVDVELGMNISCKDVMND